MRSLLTLLLLLFTVPVLAQQSADLTWEPPTTFESGDPLPPGYLTGYRIYWSVEGGASGEVDVGVDAGDSQTINLDLAPRPEPYVFTATIRAFGQHGSQSRHSEPATRTFHVEPGNPNPPTGVEIIFTNAAGVTIRVVE